MTLSIQGRVSVKLRTQNDFDYTRQSFCKTKDAEWL